MAEGQLAAQKSLKKNNKKKSLKKQEATETAEEVLNGNLHESAPKEKRSKKNGAKHAEVDGTKKAKKRKRESQADEAATGYIAPAKVEATAPSTKDASNKKKKKQLLLEQQESEQNAAGQEGAVTDAAQADSELAKKKKRKQKKILEDEENGASHAQLSPVAANETVSMQTPSRAVSAPAELDSSAVPTGGVAKKEKKKKKSKKSKGDGETVCAADEAAAPAAAVTPAAENAEITPSAPAAEVVAEGGEQYDAQDYDVGEEWGAEEEQVQVNRSFRRVKSEDWIGKKGSMKNSYEATFGTGGWGAKAQQVLGATRGKGFRHEKTKKKRGSYMGGKIDSSARASFKYDSD